LCKENITGIFARCILAPKGCRGGQKKYNVNIKKMRKGKEGKVRVLCIHAFMHPHHIIPFFLSSKTYFEKSEKENKGPQGQVFSWAHFTSFSKGIHVVFVYA